MIELKNVSKTFHLKHGDYHALTDINLTIHQGEIFGVLGSSGAGKSTLVRTINLLEKPSVGEVYVNGINLTRLSDKKLKLARRDIGMIFQQFNLLQSSDVYHNIALPLTFLGRSKAEILEKVSALMKLTALDGYDKHYPHQLSGGQQQRVAIARALTTEPKILLCDEPTSSLDPNTTQNILTLLKEINRSLNVTIVLITHEMNVAKQICDRIAVLDKGQLVECGSVLQLFAQPKTTITKSLIQKYLPQLPDTIEQFKCHANGKNCLVQFTFFGEGSEQPFIASLIKKFNITVNIIQAQIESIQNTTIGMMMCMLHGREEDIILSLEYAQQSSISAEVINHV